MFIHVFRRNEMKSSSLILMGIAVVAVGMFALPSTVSLFSGQHTWYAIHGENELPCRKCHAEIFEELENSAFHKWNGYGWGENASGSPDNSACYGCHRANASITYAGVGTSVTDVTPGTKAHAASTVACMLCHQFNASQAVNQFEGESMPGFAAGGFEKPANSPYNYTNGTEYPGGHAAHQGFIESAVNDKKMEDANEACIACHTHVPVKINWTHRYSLEFNCTPTLDLPPTHFNVTDWTRNGTYNITVYGGRNGTSVDTGTGTPTSPPPGWPGTWPGQNESS